MVNGLLNELGFIENKVELCSDNQSAIFLSRNPVFHDRTKHIDVKFHFIRDIIEKSDIKLVKISTKVNPADAGTKVIPLSKFHDSLKLLNLETN